MINFYIAEIINITTTIIDSDIIKTLQNIETDYLIEQNTIYITKKNVSYKNTQKKNIKAQKTKYYLSTINTQLIRTSPTTITITAIITY